MTASSIAPIWIRWARWCARAAIARARAPRRRIKPSRRSPAMSAAATPSRSLAACSSATMRLRASRPLPTRSSANDQGAMNGLTFRAVKDDGSGLSLDPLFDARWPNYLRWYLLDGDGARPTFLACARSLKDHMPELVPAWERLTERFGGTDLVARFLSLWQPPDFVSGCTQALWTRDRPALIRNYDYPPALCDAVLLHGHFASMATLAMTDCLWGVLDGTNQEGLSVSLAFGGRRSKGEGFGIAIVLRYILETCRHAKDALKVLKRVPVHLPYNLAIID